MIYYRAQQEKVSKVKIVLASVQRQAMSNFLSFTIRGDLQNHTSYVTCTACPTDKIKCLRKHVNFNEESIALKISLCCFIPYLIPFILFLFYSSYFFYCGNLRVFLFMHQ